VPADTSDDLPSLAVRCVRALMERHGLPKYRQSAWLADVTGLSYAQAHRRMNGAAAWTLEELEKVAGLFGESLADAVGRVQSQSAVPGVMRIGAASVPCELWIGERLAHPKPDTMVAIRTSTGWAAVVASEAADNLTYAVERLHAKPSAVERKRIAVLDDDHDLTDSVCAHLQDTGYEARGYYRTPDLQAAFKAEPFDAYLIDWIVGEGSTLSLIAEIRSQSPVPILVLTAQMATGAVDEDEIASAVAAHDLVFTEKPVRMSILSASLARALSA
jgi:CheY-like chemotaxis protein